ncbi:hypothetical protein [Spirillospora sp. NPDC047279]|uniref:hypothetical protein n=1 Tax=Spirillospora sp. NPDC047279 TaxID=3155478 RepID=UPI0033E4CD5B
MIYWPAHVLAFAASGLYFLGFAAFKTAAARMPPLDGTRPFHLAVAILTSLRWWCGATVMLAGVIFQFGAFDRSGRATVVPALLAGLIVLLVVAGQGFREHVTAREWLAFALMLGAGMAVARATGGGWQPPPSNGLLVLAVASFVIPVALFALGDQRPAGAHARRLNGIAYGMCAGILIGFGELSLTLMARHGLDRQLLTSTVHPYLFVTAVGIGVLQLQIALQRCRMVVVLFVATVVAKIYVLLAGAPLTGFPTMSSRAHLVAGLALLVIAFALVPRFEAEPAGRRPPEPARSRQRAMGR